MSIFKEQNSITLEKNWLIMLLVSDMERMVLAEPIYVSSTAENKLMTLLIFNNFVSFKESHQF